MATMLTGGKKEKVEYIEQRRTKIQSLENSVDAFKKYTISSVVINLILLGVIIWMS